MPGIFGLITKLPRQRAEQDLLRMSSTLRHESFYESGTWMDESLGVYVGWTARTNSFSAAMPARNESGDICLVFAGEEFPDPGIASRLNGHRHASKPKGPIYLIRFYEEDPTFPAGLNGRFQGLLIDKRRCTAMLFNDRYGMYRVYCHESNEAFYFAAEAKAILAVCPELREADPQGLGEFLACGCVLENRTLFKGIQTLPPAAAWVFHGGRLERKGTYFAPAEWENQEPLDPKTYYRELREVFSRNLSRYFNGQERIGMSLTGGLDTRMIMAWHKPEPQSLPCYTFGGPFRDCQDVIIARRVANICDQPYQVIPIGDEFLSRFPYYAERTIYLSDGCAPVNRAADLYVNELAAQIAPVRMTGNYGSEILRRLRMFKPTEPTPGLLNQELLGHVNAAKNTYAALIPRHAVSFTAFRQAPWYQYGLLGLEQTQLTLRSPFLDNDLVRTAFRAPNSAIPKSDIFEDSDDCARLIREGNPHLGRIRTDRGLGGARGKWSAAMSRAVLEFTFRTEYAFDYGMPQWLARIDHVLAPFHPERLFLGRHKFCHFRVWYRDQLANYVQAMLLDPRTLSRPYLERKGLESIVQGHLEGTHNYTSEIHKVLTLEILHRVFIDRT